MDRLDPAPELPPRHRKPRKKSAEAAVRRDLARLPEDLRGSAVAVTAVMLARVLDEGGIPPRDAAGCIRELRMCMTQLREWNPAGETGDESDESRARVEETSAKIAQLRAVPAERA